MSPLRSRAGPCDRADADVELLPDDVREARLAEPGRADEEHVVERFAACLRRLERDRDLLLHALLADELVEAARPERLVERIVLFDRHGSEELRAHAALRRARRTRSSGGRSGSVSASARSASTTV